MSFPAVWVRCDDVVRGVQYSSVGECVVSKPTPTARRNESHPRHRNDHHAPP